MIPEGWKEVKVGDALEVVNNLRKPISSDERAKIQGQYPYYGPTKVQDWINEYAYAGRYALIGEDGDHFLKFDSLSMTQIVEGKFNVNNHAHVLRSTDVCTADWFHRYFQHRSVAKYLTRQGAKRYKLNKAALQDIPMLVPPIREQGIIVQIIATWDQAIEATEKLIANSEVQKKALMQQLLTGKKRLPGFDGEIHFKPLTEISTIETGSSNREDSSEVGNYTFFDRSTDIRRSDRFLFDKEAIIVGGEGQEFIPKYFVGKFDLHQRAYAISGFSEAHGLYVYYSIYFRRHLLRRFSVGSTVASLRMSTFTKIPVAMISVEEQQAIADLLMACDSTIEKLKENYARLNREKSALMQQLLTGKRRVATNEEQAA